MKYKTYRFGDVTINYDNKRVPLSSAQREKRKGMYRYFGAQGVIDYIDDYIYDGAYLLIAEDGENLKSKKQNIAQLVDGQFWVNNHAHIVQANALCDLKYLCYAFNNIDVSGYITGSAQPKLSQANLNSIQLQLPSLEEQKRIASVLSSLDNKIELNNRINKNLEAQAQAIFKSWFVDFEPFQGAEFVDSELGQIPKGWKVGTIANLGDIVGGSTPSKAKPEYYTDKGIAWLTPKDLSIQKNKFIFHGETDITELGLKNSSARLMPKGTVLFSSRAPIGYMAIAGNEVSTNQGFKSIVPFSYIGTPYVYFYLKTNLERIESSASGSTFREVSGSTMKNIPALIPCNNALIQFSQLCDTIFLQQQKLEQQNQTLSKLRDTLLPKLMSGEIQIPQEV